MSIGSSMGRLPKLQLALQRTISAATSVRFFSPYLGAHRTWSTGVVIKVTITRAQITRHISNLKMVALLQSSRQEAQRDAALPCFSVAQLMPGSFYWRHSRWVWASYILTLQRCTEACAFFAERPAAKDAKKLVWVNCWQPHYRVRGQRCH